MALDPDDLVEIDSDVPDLAGVVLLHHVDGFMDAGSAGATVAAHLLETHEHRVVARFDVDDLIDYRARRPAMTYDTDRWVDYAAPELVVHLLHDALGTPFLLLAGPEPDRGWEAVAAAVRGLVERWGVRLTIGFHGIPMGVPHTRELTVISHATRPELVTDKSPFSRVQVPGHLSALLEYRLGQAGHDAMGLAAYVPHYLAQSTYPAAALKLLDALTSAAGLVTTTDPLREAAARANAEIARQIADSDEITELVHGLEQQYDAFTSSPETLLTDTEQVPSADELGAAFERFLSEQPRDN
ncbi:PAC2 family protein [Actinokineospora auranticolor]|uniref:Putative ATP-grasp superfamily ATP-dependent carboligase n=1 Tax=Actinokineospora auranticolor TaxID=155976 RepID=A0A2S6GLD7_9PSEU|nr:PAC2 family protein [Actinokineospora auranticolor]PPK66039.1 putative ATP-grasp superfamily ATP-dependent carboligase [Actinokineospora auranticolor]